MSKHLAFSSLTVLACTALIFAACSSDRGSGGTIRVKHPDATTMGGEEDSGTGVMLDSGTMETPDSGTNMTCHNPACDPNELQGPFPGCACLHTCMGNLIYNVNTGHCESQMGTPDSGVPPGMDGGTTMMGCTTSASCPPPNQACARDDTTTQSVQQCAGQSDCACVHTCAFDQPAVGCNTGERCAFAGDMSNLQGRGLCGPANGGRAHAQSCMATFSGTTRMGDNCEVGNYCLGATSMDPTGTCTQLCNPQNPAPCTQLGNYQCDNFGNPAATIGVCRTISTATDVGRSCTTNTNCQGNLCSMPLANSCSVDCTDPINACPTNALCVGLTGGGSICAKTCIAGTGGDQTCSGLNTNTVCETLGAPPDTFDICIPKCTSDTECMPQTCNMTTGHCQ